MEGNRRQPTWRAHGGATPAKMITSGLGVQVEVVLIPDFDQFAEAQTGLGCGGDVLYR
jgi:hypothetical protein